MTKSAVVLALLCSLAALACKKAEDPPPVQAGYPQQQPAYGQPGYGQQPAYGQAPAAVPAAAPPVAAPAPAPAAPAAGTLSTPSPLAFPCSTDAQCFTHRCNTAAGKCAWPCATDTDCTPGNRCMAPACVPGGQ